MGDRSETLSISTHFWKLEDSSKETPEIKTCPNIPEYSEHLLAPRDILQNFTFDLQRDHNTTGNSLLNTEQCY